MQKKVRIQCFFCTQIIWAFACESKELDEVLLKTKKESCFFAKIEKKC